jgi:hypothetical protein
MSDKKWVLIAIIALLFVVLCDVDITEDKKIVTDVDVTVYSLVPSQTDSTPRITADGTFIKAINYGKLRYCAVSRNLLKSHGGFLEFNDIIHIDIPNSPFNGPWKVKDVMNPRWKNKVDLLVNENTHPYSYKNVELSKYE